MCARHRFLTSLFAMLEPACLNGLEVHSLFSDGKDDTPLTKDSVVVASMSGLEDWPLDERSNASG